MWVKQYDLYLEKSLLLTDNVYFIFTNKNILLQPKSMYAGQCLLGLKFTLNPSWNTHIRTIAEEPGRMAGPLYGA